MSLLIVTFEPSLGAQRQAKADADTPMISKKTAAISLLVLVFAGGLVGAIRKSTSELPVYTTGAARMLAGEEIYRADDPKPFTYPPVFALPFVPLVPLPVWLHRPVWYLVNVAALAVVIVLLRRCVQPVVAGNPGRRGPPAWVFWLIVFVLGGRHVGSVFENQSHDMLVFLCVMVSIHAACTGREGAAGVWAGLGAACKATPALFAPVFVWQRRFRAALFVGLAAIAFTVLPDLVLPRQDGGMWAMSWHGTFVSGIKPGQTAEVKGAWTAWNRLNQNLAGTIYRLTTKPEYEDEHVFDVSIWTSGERARRTLTLSAQLLVIGLLLCATRPGLARRTEADDLAFRRFGEGGAVACCMVLLSPMSSKSHFCVLLIPIAFCVAHLLYRQRDRIITALMILVFIAGTMTTKGLVGRQIGDRLLACGTVTLCALAALAATAYILCRGLKSHDDRQGVQKECEEGRQPHET